MTQKLVRHVRLRDVLAAGMILVACSLLFSGCVFDTSGIDVVLEYRSQCKGKIYQYGTLPGLTPTFGKLKRGAHAWVIDWKPFVLGVHLYGNQAPTTPWKPSHIFQSVKGSYLLQVHQDDRFETQNPVVNPNDYFIKLLLKNKDIDGIWIAYDRRALSVPTWLKTKFQLPASFDKVPTTVKDALGLDVRFWIWEPKDLEALLRDDLLLGGNNAAGVNWKGGTVGEQYLVLVRPKPRIDPSNKKEIANEVVIEYCDTGCAAPAVPSQPLKDRAVKATLQEWVDKPANKVKWKTSHDQGRLVLEQDDSTCECVEAPAVGKWCSKLTAGDGTNRRVNAWMRSSIGAIDASDSTLAVEVIDVDSGNVTGSGVAQLEGEIEFHIDTQSNVQLGELTMYGQNVTLSDGTRLDDISIGQDATIVAFCDDGLPPGPFRLCGDYLVPDLPEPGFQASAYCKVNGHQLTVELDNAAPMPLQVDLNAMTFLMVGGPLEGSFKINGTDYLVRIRIDMGGHFTSLAPVASIAETPRYWECGDGGIAHVMLDASASDDQLNPGTVIGYRWVEDEGAVTENVLGNSMAITESMVFGIHDITLNVQDNDLVWSSLDLEIEVGDSKIDSVNPPADIWRLVPPRTPGEYVNIGQGYGDDICSGQVLVTNDADPSGWYSPGLSVVNWRFDDFNGNIVNHQQKIFLVEPIFFPPPISAASVLGDHIGYGELQQIFHETQSQGLPVVVDEYVVLYGPNEFVASIAWGEILHNEIVANATDVDFGMEPTFETVFEGEVSDSLPEPGLYTVEISLVRPGGDPREPADVIARDWASFSFGDEE